MIIRRINVYYIKLKCIGRCKLIRAIEVKRPYRHFKGNLYYVHNIEESIETGEKVVIYQGLYEPYDMYAKSLKTFMEEVDQNREDNTTHQNYRFEIYRGK